MKYWFQLSSDRILTKMHQCAPMCTVLCRDKSWSADELKPAVGPTVNTLFNLSLGWPPLDFCHIGPSESKGQGRAWPQNLENRKKAQRLLLKLRCYLFVILSRSNRCKEIWILRPFSKATEKSLITWFSQSCFAFDQFYFEQFTLVRPTQAKIQLLTISCQIFTVLLKWFFFKSLGL